MKLKQAAIMTGIIFSLLGIITIFDHIS